jgi:hypothetical protein
LMIAKLTYYLINVWVYGWYHSSSWGVQKGLHGPYGHLGHPIPICFFMAVQLCIFISNQDDT